MPAYSLLIDFFEWTARAGGLIAIFLLLLGFIFREKWKQILRRSLAEDLERLKSELAKSQAEHAASLTPQIEQIKHDFQQKMEAYKVSLIAEAEAVKAKGDLRKSIALRYSEIEFERLVKLEHCLAPIASDILSLAQCDTNEKSGAQVKQAIDWTHALGTAAEEAEMFLSFDIRELILNFRSQLIDIVQTYIGPNKPTLSTDHNDKTKTLQAAVLAHNKIKERIRGLGSL